MKMSELMKRIPYTQIELADMIGVSQTAISHFVNGRGMSLKVAHAIDVLAKVESGTAYAAAKIVQKERHKKAKLRLEQMGIDLQPPAQSPDECENP